MTAYKEATAQHDEDLDASNPVKKSKMEKPKARDVCLSVLRGEPALS